jgi:cytochrome c-type biogenesis protein
MAGYRVPMEIGQLPAYAALLAALAAGAVSFLSPCVAPLVPGYVAFLAGEDAGPRRSLLRAIAFVAGFAVVFTALGATAGSLSRLLLQHRAELELASGCVVALLGLAMVWGRSMLPRTRAAGVASRVRQPVTYLGAAAVGAAFSVAWSPCIGPVLASILTVAAAAEHAGWGALLLLVYSVGLGLPFVLVALGVGRARTWSRALRAHGRAIQLVSGLLMIAMGLLIAAGVLGAVTGRLASLAPAIL